MSSNCIYDWGGTRAYYRFITFFVTSYYFSYRLHIYVNSKSYFSLVCLFTHFRMCFIPLVTWIDSIVGSCVIFILLYCMQKIYPEGLGEGYKITFVTWIYSGTERDFYRFIFSILL